MDSRELRRKFIDFFKERDHQLVPSAGLVPKDDPSVLFTTAGMQQFKRFYTYSEEAPAKNVVTCQPCLRTSDIENVGDDTHLTLLEMLGNFSFGGYFKKEAIEWGYEFLTRELGISPERITSTIFKGDDINPRDDESAKILKNMGLDFTEHSREDNFWGPTGEKGPCGPTVEFYVSPAEASAKGGIDNVEVWNLVFNQYYKENGNYRPLETQGVDTGMGLERMLSVKNNFGSVYESDLFRNILRKIEEISDRKYEEQKQEFRIIADHAKAAAFAISDDILPSNKDRGYIVRRLIRRAIVKGNSIGIEKNILSDLIQRVFEIYEGVYEFPRENILSEIQKEEIKFRATLNSGLKVLKSKTEISGKDLFDLYQSYGLPVEIALEEAKNLRITINSKATLDFNQLLKDHQELSRTASAGMFRGGLAGGGEAETKYHTATHLLLASLRQVLGKTVHQKGSNITVERLRFDFSYGEKLEEEQIKKVEDLVNAQIEADLPVFAEEMSLEDAQKCGAIGEFGEKYGFKVKVYSTGKFSKEICGGPHVESTGELGHFKIIKEESSSSGIRRIKAILE